jgi:hypothetical protein
MIATDHFVFLHLHKSGGTFVNQWLARNFPDARRLGYHLPRTMVPPDLAHLPVIGLIRNPWSYYVSWFTFQAEMKRPNALFRILSDDGRLGFEPTIRAMLGLGSGGAHLDAIMAALPLTYGKRGLNLPSGEIARIRGSGLGFYAFLHDYLYAGDPPATVARMEAMRDALPPMIEATGAVLTPQAKAELGTLPAVNRSNHRPYGEYYGPALRDLVGERDAPVIERYGYAFGD